MRLCLQFGNLGESECAVLNTARSAGIRAIWALICLFIAAEIFSQFGDDFAGFAAFGVSFLPATVVAVGVQAIVVQAMVVQSPS